MIQADRLTVRLNTELVSTDVMEFELLLRQARDAAHPGVQAATLIRALDLYRGELLPGMYAEWILPEQHRLALSCEEAAQRLVSLLEQSGDLSSARRYATWIVQMSPLREEGHRDLIRLLIRTGHPDPALRQFRILERLLRENLDAEPDPKTRALVAGLGSGTGPNGSLPPGMSATVTPQFPLLEALGGAVPLDSRFYIVRPSDAELLSAVARRETLVLVQGAAQMGKTSLLARGLQYERGRGTRIVLTDLQKLNAAQFASAEVFLLTLARWISEQLDLDADPAETWDPARGPSGSFDRFMRRCVLKKTSGHLVWSLDEADRLFPCPFGTEIFRLFRSWHNERALDPEGPWSRLTLVIAYAAQAHLFIADLNQSPFNVGSRIVLEDFTPEQVAHLNQRYGSPCSRSELEQLVRLVGGHPMLVRRGLHELAMHGVRPDAFLRTIRRDGGIYTEHLQSVLACVEKDSELRVAVQAALEGRPCPDASRFYRLRSAGILSGESPVTARPRCGLYGRFLKQRLS